MVSIAAFRCLNLCKPLSCMSQTFRTKFFWGHHTLEEQQAEREKKMNEGLVVEWKNPSELSLVREVASYVPARIENEENALDNGFSREDFGGADFYQITTRPILPYFFEREYYLNQKKIKDYKKLIQNQRFIRERLQTLGPDLSAAHFLVARGGKVRFKGSPTWISSAFPNFLPDPSVLPDNYEPGWYIEEIDVRDSNLIYEGFQNIRNLIFLRILDVSYCPFIDSWCMDRISGEYQESLEEINLSGCRNLSGSGLECLWRFKRLKVVTLKDLDHIKELKLICLMLLDIFPDLEIRGVDYMDMSLLKGTAYEAMYFELEQLALGSGEKMENS